MVFKCKMCGGDLTPKEGTNIGVCNYCKSTMTLPNLENEKIVNLYNRANDLRLSNRFDESKEIYEKILLVNNSEIEAHWGILLCKYGIEYVDDPKTKKKIPTCHRTIDASILTDADFKYIKKEAFGEALELYVEEAKAIDKIQTNILNISKKEKPYDIFICYKETDEAGERTKDSVIAEDIYDKLTENGLKVFFAKITLESKLGTEYEPYIYSALKSAKVMLVIGTKEEYFNAVWVKNEWSRFLEMMNHNKGKSLIPVYSGIDAYKLPEEFAMLQAQNMDKIGAIQDLVRGTKKIVSEYKTDSDYEDINNDTIEKVAAAIGDARSIGNGMYEVTIFKEKLPTWYYLLISATFAFGFFFSIALLGTSIFFHLKSNAQVEIFTISRYVTKLPLVLLGMFIILNIIGLICSIINRKTFQKRKYFFITAILCLCLMNIIPIKYGYIPGNRLLTLNIDILNSIWFFYIVYLILFLIIWFIKPTWQINASSKSLMNKEEKDKQLVKNQEIKDNYSKKDNTKISKRYLLALIIILIIAIVYNSFIAASSLKGSPINSNKDQLEVLKNNVMYKVVGTSIPNGYVKKGETYDIVNVSRGNDNKIYIKIKNGAGIEGYINSNNVKVKCSANTSNCTKMFTQTNEIDNTKKQLRVKSEYINIREDATTYSNNLGKVYKNEIYTILKEQQNGNEYWYKIKTTNEITGWIIGFYRNEELIEIISTDNFNW